MHVLFRLFTCLTLLWLALCYHKLVFHIVSVDFGNISITIHTLAQKKKQISETCIYIVISTCLMIYQHLMLYSFSHEIWSQHLKSAISSCFAVYTLQRHSRRFAGNCKDKWDSMARQTWSSCFLYVTRQQFDIN